MIITKAFVSSEETAVYYNLAWVEGKIFNGTLKAGLFEYTPAYGLIADSCLKEFAYNWNAGKNFTFGLYAGRGGQDTWDFPAIKPNIINTTPAKVYGADVVFIINENLDLKSSFLQFQLDEGKTLPIDYTIWPSAHTGSKFNTQKVNADTKLGPNWLLKTAYAQSNVDVKNKAYVYRASYGTYNKAKPGSRVLMKLV